MLPGIHHNPHVPEPYDQVTRLGVAHAQELPRTTVKIQRPGVGIRVSRLLIQPVDQVRAIWRESFFVIRPGHSLDNPPPLFQAERAHSRRNCGRLGAVSCRLRPALLRVGQRRLYLLPRR